MIMFDPLLGFGQACEHALTRGRGKNRAFCSLCAGCETCCAAGKTGCTAKHMNSVGVQGHTRRKRKATGAPGGGEAEPRAPLVEQRDGGDASDDGDADVAEGGQGAAANDDGVSVPGSPVPDCSTHKQAMCILQEHEGKCIRCCGCPPRATPTVLEPSSRPALPRAVRFVGVVDDLPPAVSAACASADPAYMAYPLPDSVSGGGGGRERLTNALSSVGDLLNSVVPGNSRTSNLKFARPDLGRAGVALDGLGPGPDAAPGEEARMRSACASTVGRAIIALVEYLCGGQTPHLVSVWEAACQYVHRTLGTTEHLYPQHAENVAIVDAVVSAAQGILVSQPKGSPATKAVLALLAGAHRGLWARVSEHPAGEEVGVAAASGVVPDRDHDSGDSDSEREDDDSEPPAQARPQVLARMRSPSKYLYKTAKRDCAALLAGLGLHRVVRTRETLRDPNILPVIVSFLFRVGVTTPLAYGVRVLKHVGAVIAANHRLGSYRALFTAFRKHYAETHAGGQPPCSLTTFYRVASVLTPKRVQVRSGVVSRRVHPSPSASLTHPCPFLCPHLRRPQPPAIQSSLSICTPPLIASTM